MGTYIYHRQEIDYRIDDYLLFRDDRYMIYR